MVGAEFGEVICRVCSREAETSRISKCLCGDDEEQLMERRDKIRHVNVMHDLTRPIVFIYFSFGFYFCRIWFIYTCLVHIRILKSSHLVQLKLF